jgi:hypothetical protein
MRAKELLKPLFPHTGHCVALGGSLEKRSSWLRRRVQPLQWHKTNKVVRVGAVLFQFRIVERQM